jgi:hypothetical protein
LLVQEMNAIFEDEGEAPIVTVHCSSDRLKVKIAIYADQG